MYNTVHNLLLFDFPCGKSSDISKIGLNWKENILLKTMYDLPSQDNIEEVIVDAGAAKGQSQPILVHSKADSKSKSNKPTAA